MSLFVLDKSSAVQVLCFVEFVSFYGVEWLLSESFWFHQAASFLVLCKENRLVQGVGGSFYCLHLLGCWLPQLQVWDIGGKTNPKQLTIVLFLGFPGPQPVYLLLSTFRSLLVFILYIMSLVLVVFSGRGGKSMSVLSSWKLYPHFLFLIINILNIQESREATPTHLFLRFKTCKCFPVCLTYFYCFKVNYRYNDI